jgi:hypothetical protein
MFTPDSLLDIAIASETEIRALSANHKDTQKMESAFLCALWMENNHRSSMITVGPFGELPIKPGDRVRIAKGSQVFGRITNAESAAGKSTMRIAGCSHVVTVQNTNAGYAGYDYQDRLVVRQQQVVWSGQRDWRRTDAENVTVL